MARFFTPLLAVVTMIGAVQSQMPNGNPLGQLGQMAQGFGQSLGQMGQTFGQDMASQAQNMAAFGQNMALNGQNMAMNGQSMAMNGQNMASMGQGGLGEVIRQLPARGMAMINGILSGARDLIPSLGRNSNTQLGQQTSGPNMSNSSGLGMLSGILNGARGLMGRNGNMMQQGQQSSGGLNLPEPINGMVKPLTDALQQNGLPDLQRASGQMGQAIQNTLSNVLPNGSSSGSNGGLGALLNGATGGQSSSGSASSGN